MPKSCRSAVSPWSARAPSRPTASGFATSWCGLTRIPQVVVVSGLAFRGGRGLPSCGVGGGIPTVGVLANPLPDVTPAQHTSVALDMIERGGALISELHSQSKQRGTFYLARNRIIAGLSAGTVVIESPASGGSLATAHYADGYDRTVMAPPGRTTDANSFGTNSLIRNRKALLIRSADDIAEELQWEFALSRDEKDRSRTHARTDGRGAGGAVAAGRRTPHAGRTDRRERPRLRRAERPAHGTRTSQAVRQLPGNRYERFR